MFHCITAIELNQVDEDGETILYSASQMGYKDLVRTLIGHKEIDVNKPAVVGKTALYISSERGHGKVVDELLRHQNIDVNKADSAGISPLQVAIKNGHHKIVQYLIKHKKMEPNQADYNDITALMDAARKGDLKIIREVLSHPQLDANKGTWEGMTALFFACELGKTEVVKLLLRCPQTNTVLLNEFGKTALQSATINFNEIRDAFQDRPGLLRMGHTCCSQDVKKGLQIAAQGGDNKTVKNFLLCPGIIINEGYPSGLTPLYLAARANHIQVIDTLLRFPQIEVNADVNGENALLIATEYGFTNVVELLLSHQQIDINLTKRGNQGSALFLASKMGYVSIVKMLLFQPQIDVNLKYGGKSALSVASEEGWMDVVILLLQCPKTNVDGFDNTILDSSANPTVTEILPQHKSCCLNENEGLILAAKTDDYRAIRGLAQCPDADINYDGTGKTPLYIASLMGHAKTVDAILKQQKTKPNKGRTTDGKSPFSIASEKGYSNIMALFLKNDNADVNKGWDYDRWPTLEDSTDRVNFAYDLEKKGKKSIQP